LTRLGLEKRRVRLLPLCYGFVSQTGSLENAFGLASDIMKVLNYAGGSSIDSIRGLLAIYIASLNLESKKT